MLAAKRLADIRLEMSLKECFTHTPLPNVNKAAHFSCVPQRRCHKESTMVVWEFKKKKKYHQSWRIGKDARQFCNKQIYIWTIILAQGTYTVSIQSIQSKDNVVYLHFHSHRLPRLWLRDILWFPIQWLTKNSLK